MATEEYWQTILLTLKLAGITTLILLVISNPWPFSFQPVRLPETTTVSQIPLV
jgi:ABC-type molybdate transport system permease subunit